VKPVGLPLSSELTTDRASLKGGPEGRRPSRDQPGILDQVKGLFQEAYNAVPASATPTGVAGAGA